MHNIWLNCRKLLYHLYPNTSRAASVAQTVVWYMSGGILRGVAYGDQRVRRMYARAQRLLR